MPRTEDVEQLIRDKIISRAPGWAPETRKTIRTTAGELDTDVSAVQRAFRQLCEEHLLVKNDRYHTVADLSQPLYSRARTIKPAGIGVRQILIVMPDVATDQYWTGLVDAVYKRLAPIEDFEAVVLYLDTLPLNGKIRRIDEAIRSKRYSGALVVPPREIAENPNATKLFMDALDASLPTVFVDRYPQIDSDRNRNIFFEERRISSNDPEASNYPFPGVLACNNTASHKLAMHLMEEGECSDLLVIGGGHPSYRSTMGARLEGFSDVAAKNSDKVKIKIVNDFNANDEDGLRGNITDILIDYSSQIRDTERGFRLGIITLEGIKFKIVFEQLKTLYQAGAFDRGASRYKSLFELIGTGGPVVLASFDDLDVLTLLDITSVHNPIREMSEEAVDILLAWLNGTPPQQTIIFKETRVDKRSSLPIRESTHSLFRG